MECMNSNLDTKVTSKKITKEKKTNKKTGVRFSLYTNKFFVPCFLCLFVLLYSMRIRVDSSLSVRFLVSHFELRTLHYCGKPLVEKIFLHHNITLIVVINDNILWWNNLYIQQKRELDNVCCDFICRIMCFYMYIEMYFKIKESYVKRSLT